jgi:hypothetical protein
MEEDVLTPVDPGTHEAFVSVSDFPIDPAIN